MANALQYPNLSVTYNGISQSLVQSVTINGDSGLGTLFNPSGSLPVHGPTVVNVSVDYLSETIVDPTGDISGLREPVNIGINTLSAVGCFLNSVQYNLNNNGFFISSFSYQGDGIEQSEPLLDITEGGGEDDGDDGDGEDETLPAESGRAPYRVFFDSDGSSFSSENLKSVSINYLYEREWIYGQGDSKPLSVLKYPVESTISFTMYASYKNSSLGEDHATTLDNLYTGVYLKQLSCDDLTPTENLTVGILGPSGVSLTFAGVQIQEMSVDGGSVGGEPLEYSLTFAHNTYSGIKPRKYKYI